MLAGQQEQAVRRAEVSAGSAVIAARTSPGVAALRWYRLTMSRK
jgi:hypothetical protein